MKIKFKSRISGIARVAYKTTEITCDTYLVLHPGDAYKSVYVGYRTASCYSIQVDGEGVYELKPGSKVEDIH